MGHGVVQYGGEETVLEVVESSVFDSFLPHVSFTALGNCKYQRAWRGDYDLKLYNMFERLLNGVLSLLQSMNMTGLQGSLLRYNSNVT